MSNDYVNIRSKLKVQCDKGHEYEVTFDGFRTGRRCITCIKNDQRHSHEFVKEQIEQCGYKLLSKRYINNITTFKIECDEGHEYETN